MERKHTGDEQRRLVPLSEMDDYEVADKDPDVRGWDVISVDGRKLGEVEELIVSPDLMKVRYLNVKVTGDSARHILLPIGAATLHEDQDQVLVGLLSSDALSNYPSYRGGDIDRDDELKVLNALTPGARPEEGDFYHHQLYDADRFYASRRGARH